ncbi:amidase [Alphaproteobacteria bacterium]|nr:amidase [Alphaproteobacteria bacterium]
MSNPKPLDPLNTIHGLYRSYQNNSTKPSIVVQAYLDEIERLNPRLGAYQNTWADTALEMAAAADKSLAAGFAAGPFYGMPYALKDIFHVEGKVTTCGSAAMIDNTASTTATMVQRLTAAGGIILGKTKTVECAFGGWGTNQKMGTPMNPWDMKTHRIPGGSSSGTAVAVASGMAPCGMGSDTGGSIRLPAAYCGLVGLKVTAGRLPLHGIMPLSQSLDTPGPIAQTVLDCLIMFNVLDGCEGWKIAQDMDNGDGLYAELDKGVSGLRLGSLADKERQKCSEDILASYDMTLGRLRAMGAEIIPFENPVSYGDMADDNGMITAVEAFHNHGRFYKDPDLPMDEDVRTRMLLGEHYHAHEYFRVLQQRKEIMADFGDAMRGFDALAMPSSTSTAPALADVDQAVSPGYFTRPFNFLEMCGLSLPINLASDGMPTSIQIVGKAHNEAMCLRVGAALELDLPPIGRPDLS